MFGNLKKKFSNAIQESARLSQTLHEQYLQRVSIATTPNSPTSSTSASESFDAFFLRKEDIPKNVNLAAGCDLLAKYEDDWENIHKSNDENAFKAEQVACQIERIEQHLKKQQTTMTNLTNCLATMPAIVEKLKECNKTIELIKNLNVEAEKRLEDLEDIVEECDLQELILQKQCELSAHKQMKMAELESYRQRIASEHQQKIRQHEQNLRRIQRERQAVFDDAFQADLAEFKQKGALPKIQKQPSKQVSLEEVVLEDKTNKDDLENFLSG